MKNGILEQLIGVPSDEEYKVIVSNLVYDEINKNMGTSLVELNLAISGYSREFKRLTAVIDKSNEFDLQSRNNNKQNTNDLINIRKRDIILSKIREKKACVELIKLYSKYINNNMEQEEYADNRDAFLHSIIIMRSEIYLNKERYIEFCSNNHIPIDYEWCERFGIFIFGNTRDKMKSKEDEKENITKFQSKVYESKSLNKRLARMSIEEILPNEDEKKDMLLFLVTIEKYISGLIHEKMENKSR